MFDSGLIILGKEYNGSTDFIISVAIVCVWNVCVYMGVMKPNQLYYKFQIKNTNTTGVRVCILQVFLLDIILC